MKRAIVMKPIVTWHVARWPRCSLGRSRRARRASSTSSPRPRTSRRSRARSAAIAITVESIAQRLPGSALRRGQAELHPQAAEGRPADRRRPRARDRLAAAADSAEPQREDPAGRATAISTPRCTAQILDIPTGPDHARDGRRAPARQPALLARSGERQAHRAARSPRSSSRAPAERQGVLRAAARRLHDAASTRPRSGGWRRWRRTRASRSSPITARFRTSPSASASTSSATSSRKPGIPPSPQHTLDLINEMKRQNVKIVLVEPYFDLKTPNSIGRETGAQVLVLPPSVGGVEGRDRLLQAVRLRHQPAGRRHQADAERSSRMDTRHARSSWRRPSSPA